MKIIVDIMGGDYSSNKAVKGAIKALDKIKSDLILCGDEEIIKSQLSKYDYDKDRVSIVHTSEVVTNNDSPTRVIKQKKDSSMVVALNMLKDNKADILVSSGSTGALLTGATLIIKKIEGIDRPALAPIFKGTNGLVMLIDSGANTNCKPENLLQFAIMGSIYMKNIMNIENPKVGLVNVGTEEGKGNELTKQTYKLLSELKDINFVGNIEGRDIPLGNVNVAVCDGFSGNLILKTIEGTGKAMSIALKQEVEKSFIKKIGAIIFDKFEFLKKKIDASEYGGAIYLGVEKPVIKCHGNSKSKGFKMAIIQADNFIRNKTIEKISNSIKIL